MLSAVVTLFYLHRDVDLAHIFYLSIVWSIATLLFEVPSGYLADRFGRKQTLLFGTFCLALSWIAMFFAHGFPAFVIIFALMSASSSCFSGTEEAFLFDSLKELGEENHMTSHNGRLHSAQHLFNIFIPAIGAWIAKDLVESQFLILITVNFFTTTGAFFVLCFLTEPIHEKNVAAQEKGIFRESVETILHRPFLLRVAINKLLIFIASFITWRACQPFLSERGVSVFWLGIFYFIMGGSIFLLQQHIGRIEKYIQATAILFWSVVVIIVALIGTLLSTAPWVLFSLLIIAIVSSNVREPVFGHIVNTYIRSRSRATTLSNLNIFKAVFDIPILFLCGYLTRLHIEYIFLLAIGLCVCALFFFPIRQRDFLRENK